MREKRDEREGKDDFLRKPDEVEVVGEGWIGVEAVMAESATVGLAVGVSWLRKPAETRLMVLTATVEGGGISVQSLMPWTNVRLSLRTRSGPRDVLTGPIGPEMTGLLVSPLGILQAAGKKGKKGKKSE